MFYSSSRCTHGFNSAHVIITCLQSIKFLSLGNQNPLGKVGKRQSATHFKWNLASRRGPELILVMCYTSSVTKVVRSSSCIMLRPSNTINQEKACHLQHLDCIWTCRARPDQSWHRSQVRSQASDGMSANKLLKDGSQYFPPEHKIL